MNDAAKAVAGGVCFCVCASQVFRHDWRQSSAIVDFPSAAITVAASTAGHAAIYVTHAITDVEISAPAKERDIAVKST
jgi:hypothetical protein